MSPSSLWMTSSSTSSWARKYHIVRFARVLTSLCRGCRAKVFHCEHIASGGHYAMKVTRKVTCSAVQRSAVLSAHVERPQCARARVHGARGGDHECMRARRNRRTSSGIRDPGGDHAGDGAVRVYFAFLSAASSHCRPNTNDQATASSWSPSDSPYCSPLLTGT